MQLRALQRLARARTRMLIELIARRDWDLCIAPYFESHYGGHAFHRYLVPGTWGYVEHAAEELGDALRELYRTLDESIGQLLDSLGSQVTVLVFSGIGMRPNTNGVHVLEETLARLGYFVRARPSSRTRVIAGARAAALNVVPRPLASWVKRRLPRDTEDRHFGRLWQESADWLRTYSYAEGEPGHSFVRVSRSFTGDREALLEEIAAELRLLENAETGAPAVADVIDIRMRTPGPNAGALPDLAVAWARGAMLERVRHPRAGVIEEDLRGLPPSEHTEEGFLIAAGPGISARDGVRVGHVVDLAPTLLHLAGAPIPTEMDGTPLDLLDPALGEPRLAEIEMGDDPWR